MGLRPQRLRWQVIGEFGKVDKAAVLDTIGVHPGFAGSGVGHALLSQLFLNLATLQVEAVLTQVSREMSTCIASCTPAASTLPNG